ncbi:MAG: hypothetical protein DSZ01_07060, partial [Gammaproteobacteria bacterium]
MQEKIRERIDSFEQWHYQFDLKGELTPAVRGEKSVRRHQQRKKHFFDPMVELFGGSLIALFGGIYYWFPKITGRLMNEALGKVQFWLMFASMNITFFPMHFV